MLANTMTKKLEIVKRVRERSYQVNGITYIVTPKYLDEGGLGWEQISEIMSEEKANQKEKITLFMDDLKKYYSRSATPKDIAADILRMLESRYKARRNRDGR